MLRLQETLLSVGVSTEVENLCVSLTSSQNLPSHVSSWLLFSSFTPDRALWPPAAACVWRTCGTPPSTMKVARSDVKRRVSTNASCHVRSAVYAVDTQQ